MKNLLQRMWNAHVLRQQKRADFRMLHMLSDRELNDLGIGRSEIRNAIYGKESNG
jgi:uncharacterized protein YjiS (DUF1127 family)